MVGIVCAQCALTLVSWLLSAALPQLAVRSLLSPEGIRWFFGSLVDNMATHQLVHIILICVASQACLHSGLVKALFQWHKLEGRARTAMNVVAIGFAMMLMIVLLLTAIPHAVLLSATGHLFPSSFSESIIAVVALAAILGAVTFGWLSGQINNLTDIQNIMVKSAERWMPWVLVYMGLAELYAAFKFVFLV